MWRRTTAASANIWSTRRSSSFQAGRRPLPHSPARCFQVVRLADCIRVTEVELDGCPRDTEPFLIETTDRIYLFSAHRQQLHDWMHKLCEVAFPVGDPADL